MLLACACITVLLSPGQYLLRGAVVSRASLLSPQTSAPSSPEAADPLTQAMDRFEATLASNPHDEVARDGERKAAVALALQLRAQNNGPAALAILERARAALPDDATLLTDIGIQADALHHYAEATEALQSALRLEPANPTAQYALARTQSDNQHPVEAEALFRAYLAQRPNDASAHYGLGHLLQMQQRNPEATAEFTQSISLQPVQTESYYQLGQMALDEHRDEQARAMFEKTLGRMAAHGGALSGMGILAYRARDFASARKWLQQAVAASPDYEPAHYYLGLSLGRLGDKEGSARELADAAKLAAAQQGKGAPIGVITSPPEPR